MLDVLILGGAMYAVIRLITAEPGAAIQNKHKESCPTCRGGGRVRIPRNRFGLNQTIGEDSYDVRTCPTCDGKGKLLVYEIVTYDSCPACDGSGQKEVIRAKKPGVFSRSTEYQEMVPCTYQGGRSYDGTETVSACNNGSVRRVRRAVDKL